MRHPRQSERGVAAVEFALAISIFLGILLTGFQLALVVIQDYGVRHATRMTARWLAINPDSTDAQVVAKAKSFALPTMRDASFTSVVATPPCPSLSGGKCASRAPGSVVSVDISYDLKPSLFLPTTFKVGTATITFPLAVPTQRVSVMVE